jgi:integrating conjugative element protein (TIGR03759 family)
MEGSRCIKIFVAATLFISMHTFAAEVENSQEESTRVENSIDKTGLSESAKEWDLNDTEWKQYQKLMQGPAGLWYRQLSPPAVLGMHANNPEERKHFAEVYAKQEHQKIEQEFAFNKAALHAMQRLYPNEPMVQPFDISPFNPSREK